MNWQAEVREAAGSGYQRPLIAGWLSLIAHLVLILAGVLLWHVPPRMALE